MSDFMSWIKPPEDYERDPREVYRSDGNGKMALIEFLVWLTRVGGLAGKGLNQKWNLG